MRFRRILTATSSGVSSFLVRVSSRWPAWGNTRGAVAREHAGAGERGRSADGYRPIVPDPASTHEPRRMEVLDDPRRQRQVTDLHGARRASTGSRSAAMTAGAVAASRFVSTASTDTATG